MDKIYHNNTRRPDAYYEQVLRILIACNTDAMTHAAMAAELNSQDIPTPTGMTWTAEHIRQLLKKTRNYKLYPSRIGQHLMQLIFEEKLSMKETLPLFKWN